MQLPVGSQDELFSQRLTRWSEEFDKVFNHLLGYIIAFTSLVAFADVLGDGQITHSMPVLYWVWVFAQGLCVEFQVFILIKRMPGYWQHNRAMFTVYGAFIACLCLMSVLIGSVFVQHDQGGGSIEQAMYALGIPHIGFIYARAALAILLVALIAIDRAIEQSQQSVQPVQQVRQPCIDEVLAPFAQCVQQMAVRQTELTEALMRVTVTVTEMRAELVQGVQMQQALAQECTQPVTERVTECVQEEQGDTEGVQDFLPDLSVANKVRAYLTEIPNASVRAVADAVGCSPTTANKWIKRVREEKEHTS